MAEEGSHRTSLDMDLMSPTNIFRWETASGLEHTCYACKMKMNNPKSRQQCYGIHSIPCIRYHQTMHAIGTSHNCFSCIAADNLHTNRHRKIAELVAEYQSEENENAVTTQKRYELRERNVNLPARQVLLVHQVGEDDGNEENMIDVASVSNSSETSTTTHKVTKAEQRARKRAAKEQKSQQKAAKNQSRHIVPVRAEDVENVRILLHGEEDDHRSGTGHPLASDSSIEEVMNRNRAFVANIDSHKRYLLTSVASRRKSDKERKRLKKRASDQHTNPAGEPEDEMDEVVNAVLLKLGVTMAERNTTSSKRLSGDVLSNQSTGKCHSNKAALVDKLREAIREDLEKHENEQRETCVRAGGFWRYVGRPVFERMTEIAQRIDWATGTILDEDA